MGPVGNQVAEDLGVYVHFPFCASRCPYCDFATEARATLPHEAYADAVLAEIAARAPDWAGRTLRSIYFGGGTPGLWRADRVAAVVAAVHAAFPPAPATGGRAPHGPPEVTVEMNPGDADAAHLGALRAGGVNRLSLGIQSLDDDELKLLGRRHGRAAALAAFRLARAAGFENLACDLIFGLPAQPVARFAGSLDELCDLGPEHVSVYNLTVEEGTPFAAQVGAGRLRLPDGGVQVDMYELARERLAAAGLRHYEVSNFARAGREAVHNGLYWRGAEYLGVGAAAHSLRLVAASDRAAGPGTTAADRVAERRANPRDPDAYMRAARDGRLGPASVERLGPEARRREALWLGLRVLDGIWRPDFRAQYGVDPVDCAAAACADLQAQGLLAVEPEVLRLTHRGLLFADEVGMRFL
ncbi:MAG: radical SAM family heme chaperone HemW [Deltaproteobacteria bacterium]|nr:radical SAM family heme chaperone HemW [Deltaproteobacteria bacterium]